MVLNISGTPLITQYTYSKIVTSIEICLLGYMVPLHRLLRVITSEEMS